MTLWDFDCRPPVHIKSCSSYGVMLGLCIPIGSPTSSTSPSFCFNEAPGRFWKALELNAVHLIQTTASSLVPVSLDQTLLHLLHTAGLPWHPQTGLKTMIYDFSRCHHMPAGRLSSGQFLDHLAVDLSSTFYDHVLFCRVTAGLRCHNIQIQEISNMSNPVMMKERGICIHIAWLCILLLSGPCVMSTLSGWLKPMFSLAHGSGLFWITLAGEMLGNSTSLHGRIWRAGLLPKGAASDPAECQICRGHQIPIGQELNMTDTKQQ